MSPYANKVIGPFRAALFSAPFFTAAITFVKAPDYSAYVWIGLAVIGLGYFVGYVLFYLFMISDLDKRAGFYVPVRSLKKIGEPRARALGIHPYYDYYEKRPEDGELRTHLGTNRGVVILGDEYSGKTRAALEAIIETHPQAYMLSFMSPDQLKPDKIQEIVVPCFLVFWRKPEVVLFVDDIEKFAASPFRELLLRLDGQCSRCLTIVATCCTKFAASALDDAHVKQLLRGVPIVKLGPLDPLTAGKIYTERLKHGPAPLTMDMSLPGLIMYGPQEMRNKYRDLPPKHKRVVTALRLASACGAVACERRFLAEILKRVLLQEVAGIEESIDEMDKKYIVIIDNNDRVSIQHEEFLQEDHRRYYPTILEFKKDLKKVVSLLFASHDADRLIFLGHYYWSILHDLVSARRALEASLQIKQSPLTNGYLARLYVWQGESERARAAINAA